MTAATRSKRRGCLMALAFAAVILLFGAFVVYRALDPDALRGVAEARLTAVFGERVTIGRMRVALFPVPAVTGTDVRIGMRAEGAAPSVGVRRIRILPQWRTLLSKPVVIDAVEIEGLAVALLRDRTADGSCRAHRGRAFSRRRRGHGDGHSGIARWTSDRARRRPIGPPARRAPGRGRCRGEWRERTTGGRGNHRHRRTAEEGPNGAGTASMDAAGLVTRHRPPRDPGSRGCPQNCMRPQSGTATCRRSSPCSGRACQPACPSRTRPLWT